MENNFGDLGQCNGGASVSWYSHMLHLEKAYEEETEKVVEYHNPDKPRRFFQWFVGFVDDNSIMLKLEYLGYDNSATCMIAATKKCMEI